MYTNTSVKLREAPVISAARASLSVVSGTPLTMPFSVFKSVKDGGEFWALNPKFWAVDRLHPDGGVQSGKFCAHSTRHDVAGDAPAAANADSGDTIALATAAARSRFRRAQRRRCEGGGLALGGDGRGGGSLQEALRIAATRAP